MFFWRLVMQYIIWSNRQNITKIRLTYRASASALLFSDIVYSIMDTLHYTSSTPFSLSLYALKTSPKDIEDREASQPVHARWGSWWECQHPHSQSHQSSLPRCWDDCPNQIHFRKNWEGMIDFWKCHGLDQDISHFYTEPFGLWHDISDTDASCLVLAASFWTLIAKWMVQPGLVTWSGDYVWLPIPQSSSTRQIHVASLYIWR